MGCTLTKDKVFNRDDEDRLDEDRLERFNRGAINVLMRSEASQRHFFSYLKSVSYGEQILKCYKDIKAIKELDDQQLCSRMAAVIWRYKAIHDDYCAMAKHKKDKKVKQSRNSKSKVPEEVIIWECLGKLRLTKVNKASTQKLIHLLDLVEKALLSHLIAPFEAYLLSPFYEKWKKASMAEEKKKLKLQAIEEHALPTFINESEEALIKSCSNVLLVDDSITTLKIAYCSLKTAGYKVQTATNGETALKAMKAMHYDVVLIDINMPILDGYETVRLFREFEKQNRLSTSAHQSELSSLSDEELDNEAPLKNHEKPIDLLEKVKCSLEITRQNSGTVTETITELHTEPPHNDNDTHDTIQRDVGDALQPQLIIGMSSDSDQETRKLVYDVEMDYFLPKPFTITKFAEAVRDADRFKRTTKLKSLKS